MKVKRRKTRLIGLLCGIILCFSSIHLSAQTFSVDITNSAYCEDVLAQMYHEATPRTVSDEGIIDFSNSFLLYNFAEEPIAIFYKLAPVGYAIYDFTNGIVLQYTTDNEHQFYVDKNEHYYYQGILEYYVHTNEGYLNLATGSIKELNAQDYSFSPNDFYVNEVAINETDIDTCSATEGPVILNKTTRLYNCNKEVNFPLFYPDKTAEELAECPGVCGSVAVGIMLECYDDYYTDLPDGYSFIDSDVKMSNAYCEDIYGLELVKRLIPYIEPGANGSYFLNPGVSSYFADRGISGGAQLGVLAVYLQTKDSIGANGTGYPLIVATSNHFMVGIGYQNTTQKQIYVNNGRGGKEWVNANTIVCTWTFMISGTM